MKTNKKYKQNHMWTKEDIKKLVTIWDDCTKQEVADEMNLTPVQVGSMVRRIRLAGYPLARKTSKGTMNLMIDEVFDELKIKKIK